MMIAIQGDPNIRQPVAEQAQPSLRRGGAVAPIGLRQRLLRQLVPFQGLHRLGSGEADAQVMVDNFRSLSRHILMRGGRRENMLGWDRI